MLDECLQQRDHRPRLHQRGRAQIHVLVVEGPERAQCRGELVDHADPSGPRRGIDHRVDKCPELLGA
jgi:hypothetical protein